MSLLFDTIHGDIIVDLNYNNPTLQTQIHNIIGLTETTFLSKLHTFSSPPLHFQYLSRHFVFFGDPMYTGKGGQSVYSLLNNLDPKNHLSSRFSTFKPLDTPDNKGSFTVQQQYDTLRRDLVKGILNRAKVMINHNNNNDNNNKNNDNNNNNNDANNNSLNNTDEYPILLLSIPHSNGDVSSLFGFYFTAPPAPANNDNFSTNNTNNNFPTNNNTNNNFPTHNNTNNNNPSRTSANPPTMSDSDPSQSPQSLQSYTIPDPFISFPECLYDYVIGEVVEGHSSLNLILKSTLPHPLLSPNPTTNTNEWLRINDDDTQNSARSDIGNGLKWKKKGDFLNQVGVVFSPFPPITTPEKLQNCIIPHHNKRLVKALRDSKQNILNNKINGANKNTDDGIKTTTKNANFSEDGFIEESINFGQFGTTNDQNSEQTELLFVDTFTYNPVTQHYPSFLKHKMFSAAFSASTDTNDTNTRQSEQELKLNPTTRMDIVDGVSPFGVSNNNDDDNNNNNNNHNDDNNNNNHNNNDNNNNNNHPTPNNIASPPKLLSLKHNNLLSHGFNVKAIDITNNNDDNGDDDDDNDNDDMKDDSTVKIQIAFEEAKNLLFISNLNHTTTQESLTSYISSHCVVLGCNIIKERMGGGASTQQQQQQQQQRQQWKCYAFIAVSTEAQCDIAINTFNKTILDGYTINVGYCHSTGNGTGNSIYYNVHMGTNPLSRRPQKATLASTIIAGGGAASINVSDRTGIM